VTCGGLVWDITSIFVEFVNSVSSGNWDVEEKGSTYVGSVVMKVDDDEFGQTGGDGKLGEEWTLEASFSSTTGFRWSFSKRRLLVVLNDEMTVEILDNQITFEILDGYCKIPVGTVWNVFAVVDNLRMVVVNDDKFDFVVVYNYYSLYVVDKDYDIVIDMDGYQMMMYYVQKVCSVIDNIVAENLDCLDSNNNVFRSDLY
jgi:hypothetical protein